MQAIPNSGVQGIPAELRARNQWIVFRTSPKADGRLAKRPLIPGTNRNASINKPATWRSFAVALADAEDRGLHLGFAITPADNLTLIDLDGAIALDGTMTPEAAALLGQLNTYSERSISSIGLHILAWGHPPTGATKPPGIEIYPGSRFVLLTGDRLAEYGSGEIQERATELARLFPTSSEPSHRLGSIPASIADDAAIIQRVRQMDKGRALHDDGNISSYKSGSEADAGLLNCYIAAGITDPDRLDTLYRTSALYPQRQKKWDNTQYRERTLGFVLNGRVTPFAGWDGARNNPVPAIAALPQTPGPCTKALEECHRIMAEQVAEIATLKQTVTTLEQTLDTLRQTQSAQARIVANKDLGPARAVAAVVANKLAWRATATETPPAEQGIDVPPGTMALSVTEIASAAGVSPNSATNHLKALEDAGQITRYTRKVRVDVDKKTGEIYEKPVYVTQHFIGPADATALTPQVAMDFSARLAGLATNRTERRGGRQIPRCPEHPNADVIRQFVDRCSQCKKPLNHGVEILPPMLLASATITPEIETSESITKFVNHTQSVVTDLLGTNFVNHPPFDSHDMPTEPGWLAEAPDFSQDEGEISDTALSLGFMPPASGQAYFSAD